MSSSRARERMGAACDENLRYALGRYVPEAVGRTRGEQIASLLSEAGLDSKPSSRPLG
jgi:hypothetical protein